MSALPALIPSASTIDPTIDMGCLSRAQPAPAIHMPARKSSSPRKKDPSKILARSREPLVYPEPTEREGYVPNVVYTCGAMRHRD
jgi:hypothetical protein